MSAAEHPRTISRQELFEKAARDYCGLDAELRSAIATERRAKAEAEKIGSKLSEAKTRLCEYVGQIVSSRCARIDDKTLLVEYGENSQHRFRIFDRDGEEVRQ